MFARVKLLTKDERDALVLPEQALVPQGEEQYVFRVVDGKAARTKVELGQRRDSKVEIVKGISPGETIVTAGQLKLRDGTPVTLATVAKAAAAPKADNGSPPAKADSGAGRAPKS
jgi:membrane fusion protein (multidrug efflux system)